MKQSTAWPCGAALLASLWLAGCGGGSSTPPGPRGDGALVAANAGDLAAYMQTKARERQTLRAGPGGLPVFGMAGDGAAAPATAGVAATTLAQSGTTVQEQGVDEDDLLKTDGSTLVTLARAAQLEIGKPWARVQLHGRRSDGGVDALGAVDLPSDAQSYGVAHGLYHLPALQRVAVLSESQQVYTYDICGGPADCPAALLLPGPPVFTKPSVWIDLVNTAAPASPALAERIRIDGRLLGSRRIGNALVLVTQHSPQLAAEVVPVSAPSGERDALIAKISAADVLPQLTRGSAAPEPLLAETDCLLQPGNASVGIEITSITVFDLGAPGAPRTSRCFVGGSEALYMSPTGLYLATTRYAYDQTQPVPVFSFQASTDIHKFAIGANAIDYRGSGEVTGHLGWDRQRTSYRLSEHNGDLRVITFSGETGWVGIAGANAPNGPPPSPAALSVLRESASAKRLVVIGKLPNAQRPAPLGKPGEQVYAVRFLGNRGYVVTFRRIDPLYVLDLSDPADPKSVGELQVAGFSDYLFPMSDSLLLGVGKDADLNGMIGGVKVALFDVADPTNPLQVASQVFGQAGSMSGLDASRHGIDIFPRGTTVRVALPLWLTGAQYTPGPRGLQRLEVDTAARTLTAKPLLAGPSTNLWLADERAVQIENHVYHFANGQLAAWLW
jgi:Beta propeller domain